MQSPNFGAHQGRTEVRSLQELFLSLLAAWAAQHVGILVSWLGIEPMPPAVEEQSLNHWTTKGVPGTSFKIWKQEQDVVATDHGP